MRHWTGFTIEVKKKRKDEEFGFKDLELFHKECFGGKIKQRHVGKVWSLNCQRCGVSCTIEVAGRGTVRIIDTAIDSQERKVNAYSEEWQSWTESHTLVVQKAET